MSKEFIFLYSLCVCTHAHVCCILGSERSTSDLFEQELQVVVSHPAWCWEPNSGPLQGHMILSTEASLWTYFQSIFSLPYFSFRVFLERLPRYLLTSQMYSFAARPRAVIILSSSISTIRRYRVPPP